MRSMNEIGLQSWVLTSVFCCCLPSPRCMTNCIGANIPANSINYFRYFLSSLVVMNKQKHKFERLTYDRLNIWSFEWLKVWKTFHVLLSWVHILTVNGSRKLLKTPNIKVLFITISENSLLQTLLQQIGHQCHHQQILRFRHHLVRTLLILHYHLIQTLCKQQYLGPYQSVT